MTYRNSLCNHACNHRQNKNSNNAKGRQHRKQKVWTFLSAIPKCTGHEKLGQYQLIWYKVWEVAGQTSELGWSWQDGKQDCFSSYRPILGTLLHFSCFLFRIHLLFYGSYFSVLLQSTSNLGLIFLIFAIDRNDSFAWFHSTNTSFHLLSFHFISFACLS